MNKAFISLIYKKLLPISKGKKSNLNRKIGKEAE